MGSLLQVTLCGTGERAAALARGVFDAVAADDALLTTWAEEGPMITFNASAGRGLQAVSPGLWAALAAARDWSIRTGGRFDPTIGPVLDLWRHAADEEKMPATEALSAARARSGIDGLQLPAKGRAALARSGMRMDPGGFGKGWALDRASRELPREAGVAWLLDFGGSSWLAHGTPPGASAWRVEIRREDGAVETLVELGNEALSVSGADGRFFEIDGQRFPHIVDPRTGRPVRRHRFSIVVAETAMAAEAWSTALVVAGPSEAAALLAEQSAEGQVREEDGSVWASGRFRASARRRDEVTHESPPALLR